MARFRDAKVLLPTFAQLAGPVDGIPAAVRTALAGIRPDAAHPLNLFRVHWYNGADRARLATIPGYVALPGELTGVEATIMVAIGARFPMIGSRKVLAAYGCLAPRIITGQFDPTRHGPSGRPPATTAGAGWRSPGCWAPGASRCCPRR